MTDQEIEKLREKLGSDYSVKRMNGAITVELVDIWRGVEFAECSESVYGYTKGNIYPFTGVSNEVGLDYLDTLHDDYGNKDNGICKRFANPSTESAYVEQLKAKAKELYGEIKDGDRFEFTWIGDGDIRNIHLKGNYDFYYDKESDTLDLHGFPLYKQGKWANKIQQAIVTPVEINSEDPDIVGDQVISIQMKIIHGHISQKNRVCVAYHLSKCLEDYLNKS